MAVKTFTAGSVLTASDTNTYLANSGLVYIGAATLSSTATYINDCFNTSFDSYRVVFSGITFSTVDEMTVRLSNSGSANTDSKYYSARFEVTNGGTGTSSVTGTNPTTFWRPNIVTDANGGGGSIEIWNPRLAVRTEFSSTGSDARSSGSWLRMAGGYYDGSTTFTGLWISTTNGGYTLGGTARVYGYRQA